MNVMNVYPVETDPINVNEVVNDIQDMEDVGYIGVNKENNDELISTYTCLLLYCIYLHSLHIQN